MWNCFKWVIKKGPQLHLNTCLDTLNTCFSAFTLEQQCLWCFSTCVWGCFLDLEFDCNYKDLGSITSDSVGLFFNSSPIPRPLLTHQEVEVLVCLHHCHAFFIFILVRLFNCRSNVALKKEHYTRNLDTGFSLWLCCSLSRPWTNSTLSTFGTAPFLILLILRVQQST